MIDSLQWPCCGREEQIRVIEHLIGLKRFLVALQWQFAMFQIIKICYYYNQNQSLLHDYEQQTKLSGRFVVKVSI